MKRIILFRFHDYKDVCQNRLQILRKYNPDIPIYGLYGGREEKFDEMKKLDFDDIYSVPIDDPYWKWLCGDLSVRWWFKDVGKNIDFHMLHVIEWDFILLEPISEFFKKIIDGIALSNIEPIEKRIQSGWVWVTGERSKEEWQRLQSLCKKAFGWNSDPVGGLFPAASMSKLFLEKYASVEVPSFCNDEVRLPIFAQSFGMNVHNISLKNPKAFNCNNDVIDVNQIPELLRNGHKAFHPVRDPLDVELLVE